MGFPTSPLCCLRKWLSIVPSPWFIHSSWSRPQSHALLPSTGLLFSMALQAGAFICLLCKSSRSPDSMSYACVIYCRDPCDYNTAQLYSDNKQFASHKPRLEAHCILGQLCSVRSERQHVKKDQPICPTTPPERPKPGVLSLGVPAHIASQPPLRLKSWRTCSLRAVRTVSS